MVQLYVQVTEAELARLQELARQHGFESPEDYMKDLALQEPTKADLLADIREGLLALKRGEAMPTLADLWTSLADSEDT